MSKTALKSPLRYPGGKKLAVNKIMEMAPDNFRAYHEPFIGGGIVMLAMIDKHPLRIKYASDLDQELITTWLTLQSETGARDMQHLVRIAHESMRVSLALGKREEFKKYLDKLKEQKHMMPHEYYVVDHCSFSGSIRMGGYSSDFNRFNESKVTQITKYHEALQSVKFRVQDYRVSLRAAHDDDFVFLDPPYYNYDDLYRHNKIDHNVLAGVLDKAKFKWLLTIDDCPEIRKLYRGHKLTSLKFAYGMSKGVNPKERKKGEELIITNY